MSETINSQIKNFENSGSLPKKCEVKTQEIETALSNLKLDNETHSGPFLDNMVFIDTPDPTVDQELKKHYQVEETMDFTNVFIDGQTTKISGQSTKNPSIFHVEVEYPDKRVDTGFGVVKNSQL